MLRRGGVKSSKTDPNERAVRKDTLVLPGWEREHPKLTCQDTALSAMIRNEMKASQVCSGVATGAAASAKTGEVHFMAMSPGPPRRSATGWGQ